jgi:hypothetical protein
MILAVDQPHIRLIDRTDRAWVFPVHELPSAMAAWTAGQAFWTSVDVWGRPSTIRLGHVVAIQHWTDESIALLDAEEAEERARALINGASE